MTTEQLKQKAKEVRIKTLELAAKSGHAHLGGSFSCIETLVALYYEIMEKDDIFILSKGHAALSLYIILNDLGIISDEVLNSYGEDNTILGGHPDKNMPGIVVNTGSLGNGVGIGAGMAMANRDKKVFVLCSDGDLCEGSTWEALDFASKNQLCNLSIYFDNNGMLSTRETDDYEDKCLYKKFESFNVEYSRIKGHNIQGIITFSRNLSKVGPYIVQAYTTKGKGVSFMENNNKFHHYVPKNAELIAAMQELQKGEPG